MIILILGVAAVGLLSASASDGKTVARWHSRSFDAQFTATGCGSPFEAKRKFSASVKRLRLREPAIGSRVLDPNGHRVSEVSSVDINRHRDGSREVIWQATPGLVCPSPLPIEPEEPPFPQPVVRSCSVLTEGFVQSLACEDVRKKEQQEAWSRWEEETAARKKAWEGEVAAHRQAEAEYRNAWGTSRRQVKTSLVYFDYKFFTRRKVVHHPAPASGPCLLVCEAKHALFGTLKAHYELTTTSASCHQLTARTVHCYFQGLTPADVREGNIAGHKGDAYVAKSSYGFDVQVVRFYRG